MAAIAPARHRFTVGDYYRLAEVGVLGPDARVELLEGEIIEMSPVGSRHAGCVNRLAALLAQGLASRAVVAVQNPVRLSDLSEPQPDLALLRPNEGYYADSHPRPEDVLLLIEVSDTTWDWDRTYKRALYSASGIVELWLVNPVVGVVEVSRQPGPGGYAETRVLGPGDTVAAAAFPDLSLAVDDIIA